ncbi:hypothetical protein HD553DRAFT_311680 [Filobasidium floriforme]|uniref:uncharacterized protein n=1 Tax=Filobasidium floriforme TaxID=5210 RepID=UPI001E8D31EC|nr:uncharacterized protein HD553DRAFT_311680 [Filobasidium floriforme]KAH8084772.1 hypothetical protein HD553DRAFT_311680 [Filobasidium floriforme]
MNTTNNTTTTTSTTSGQTVGEKGGNAITGIFQAANGLGEGIRGNINAFADSLGAGIKNDPNTAGQDTAAQRHNEQVAARGADEMRSGLDGFKRS